MSLEMYKKLKLNDLNTSSIRHVVGASGKSLGARGRTKCEVNINGKIFYQTFIVCEHLKRPIILGRDFSIQNCIAISWTKSNTRQLTQNNEVIAETGEYQTPSRTPEHKTLINALVTMNKVVSISWKLSINHTPLTYKMQRYARIAGPFYLRDRNWKSNTPERHVEHRVGYINIAITYDDWRQKPLLVVSVAKTCVQLKPYTRLLRQNHQNPFGI